MPFPLIAAGIGAAGSLIGGLINSGSQSSTNRAQQDFAEKMYNQQKADSLDMWNKQNDYNSPTSQMDRLKAAGLNPNLVFGNGSAVNTASPINVPSQGSYHPTAPRPGDAVSGGVAGGLQSYFDTSIKQATLDNMKKQNTVLAQEAALKAAQTSQLGMSTARSAFDLDLASELRQNSLDAAQANLEQTKYRTSNIFADTILKDKQIDSTAQSIRESIQRIANSQSVKIGQDQLNKMGEIDLQNKKLGIEKGDDIWYRVLGRVAHSLGLKF